MGKSIIPKNLWRCYLVRVTWNDNYDRTFDGFVSSYDSTPEEYVIKQTTADKQGFYYVKEIARIPKFNVRSVESVNE